MGGNFWILVQFFGSVVKIALHVFGGTLRGKSFFPEGKVNFVFGYDPQKYDSEKQLGMFVKTTPS